MIDSEWGSLKMSARMRHRDPLLDRTGADRQVQVHWDRVIVLSLGILLWVPILYWACR